MARASAPVGEQRHNAKVITLTSVTLPLRQRHRRIFAVLSLLLPLLFIAGIVARRAVPQYESLPPALAPKTSTFTATGDEREDLFDRSPISVRLFRDHDSGALALGLTASKDFLKPDLMVYWSARGPDTGDALPPDAVLLGPFVSAILVLPPEAAATDGRVILFSLANQEIVGVSKPARFAASTK